MVDANVMLSAIVFRSPNMLRVIEHASSEGNELVLSSWVINEVRRVVAKKWPNRAGSLDALLLAMRYELVQTPPDDEIEWGLFSKYVIRWITRCSIRQFLPMWTFLLPVTKTSLVLMSASLLY